MKFPVSSLLRIFRMLILSSKKSPTGSVEAFEMNGKRLPKHWLSAASTVPIDVTVSFVLVGRDPLEV